MNSPSPAPLIEEGAVFVAFGCTLGFGMHLRRCFFAFFALVLRCCARLCVFVASSLRLPAVLLRVVYVLRGNGNEGDGVVGAFEYGGGFGVLRVELSSSCEISASASYECSAHLVIGESAGLNGRVVGDVDVGK